MEIERRRKQRISVAADLSIRPIDEKDKDGAFIPVHVENISSGGIAFKTDKELPINSFYDMKLEVSGCDKIATVIEIVRIAAKHTDGTVYGCRFIGLGREEQFRIDVFCMVNKNMS